MSNPLEPLSGEIALCLVVRRRFGNLANALHSVSRLGAEMIVVESGEKSGEAVRHLSSEYDAQYYRVPDDADESVALNLALAKVSTPWALFLNQQEVLHAEDPQSIVDQLTHTGVLAFEFPVIRLNEPSNHHFETRLIRADRNIHWAHTIFPTLTDSLRQASKADQSVRPTQLISGAAIVSLGNPQPEEEELRENLGRIQGEVERHPEAVRYWYQLALTAAQLEDWQLAHATVEQGLSIVSQKSDVFTDEPYGVCGLIGMFCDALLSGKYYPENTVQSLWTIHSHMEADGRFSVPLSRLLLAIKRDDDAIAALHVAVDTFFSDRRYHMSLEEGLFKPALLLWEIESQRSSEILLKSVIDIQNKLNRYQYKLRAVLEYVFEHNKPLFFSIQTVLQKSLRGPA